MAHPHDPKNPKQTPPPAAGPIIKVEDDRTGMDPVTLERAMLDHLMYTCSKSETNATLLDIYEAMAHTVRDRLVHRWIATQKLYYERDVKRVYYLSAEYLPGRALKKNLVYLDVEAVTRELLEKHGLDLEQVYEAELDPGLGNGGLGRLAACYLDSMACLALPGYGYGIRYEFGIFDQRIENGWQVEHSDAWLRYGNPWELPRHEYAVDVRFYGRVDPQWDAEGNYRPRWVDTSGVVGVPYDTPCPGFQSDTVNTMRLWSARASHELNLEVFNDGDYRQAVEEKVLSEAISKVLYPQDDTPQGKELRLKQQYFFTACAIADIVRRYKKDHPTFDAFPDKVAIQLNDTHPAIAVAELMRVLVDDELLPWDQAWDITERTIAYTNHTLLAEALERWPVAMFERLLPRHLQIIYELNERFLDAVRRDHPGDGGLVARLSLIAEGGERQIRMAHLAVLGSHAINGVAALHSELIKTQLLPDFARLWPERFQNKTNGITPRRWLLLANPELARAITGRIGHGWLSDLEALEGLMEHAGDDSFITELGEIKRGHKKDLAGLIKQRMGLVVDPSSLYDVQIKRIHLYKRQLMNCLAVIRRYQEIKADPSRDWLPRTVIFAGKAAPGYAMAKLHIKLIHAVADAIHRDPDVAGRLKVVFLPNYNVSLAERIIPAADLSEQISMAGKEASGTGNMKLALNGALTIGTLDGANVEIRDHVGAENFFLFGLDAPAAKALVKKGYDPRAYIGESVALQRALNLIAAGFFSPEDPNLFRPVVSDVEERDTFLVCADFEDYCRAQAEVDVAFRDPLAWGRMVLANIAHMGYFSSDRAVHEYARDIWGATPCPVTLAE